MGNGVTAELAADFIVDAREMLESLGTQMVALEHAPGDRAALDAVFRVVHTLKGGAGFLAIEPLVALCHALEDALNAARSGTASLDAGAFDHVQHALDNVDDMVAALAEGNDPVPAPEDLLEALRAIAGVSESLDDFDFDALLDSLHGVGGAPGAPSDIPAPPPPAPAPAQPPLPPANLARAATAPARAEEPTLRIDARRLDAMVALVGELQLARNRLRVLRTRVHDDELDRAVGEVDAVSARLQSSVMAARMQPVGRVFSRFPKLARDVGRQVGKQVEVVIEGAEVELDRSLVDALGDPLVHLVRNAIDHGIEGPDTRRDIGKPGIGQVLLRASQDGDQVVIELRDDGAGIDPQRIRDSAVRKGLIDEATAAAMDDEAALDLVFLPGFSTRDAVSELSGRGVGMDVVRSSINALNGQVQIRSTVGSGTRFLLRVPLTLAILPVLLLETGGELYALPMTRVIEVVSLGARRNLPATDLRSWLGLAAEPGGCSVVLQDGATRRLLDVDRVLGREDVVLKPLPPPVRGLAGYAGTALTGDGRMALVLDVDALHGQG